MNIQVGDLAILRDDITHYTPTERSIIKNYFKKGDVVCVYALSGSDHHSRIMTKKTTESSRRFYWCLIQGYCIELYSEYLLKIE